MLRLKGQTESGEWMEFGINLVLGVNSLADRWFIGIKGKIVKILIETIQPADDPRNITAIELLKQAVDAFEEEHADEEEVLICSKWYAESKFMISHTNFDPRKAMLDEIKCEIMCRQNKPKNDFEKGWEAALANLVTSIDEMEAKL